MSEIPIDMLRTLVREAVRDAVGQAVTSNAPPQGPSVPGSQHVIRDEPRNKTVGVRLLTDDDLAAFVRQLLGMFENPKTREDLRNGWLRFSLTAAGGPTTPSRRDGAMRVDRGVLTERQVAAAAETGQSIVVARGAVITPLARDKARALGVHIEKERR